MDVKRLRPDWKVARRISKDHNLAAAQDWMRSALVDLRGHVTVSYLSIAPTIDDDGDEDWGALDDMWNDLFVGRFCKLPWLDAVYLVDHLDRSLFHVVRVSDHRAQKSQADEHDIRLIYERIDPANHIHLKTKVDRVDDSLPDIMIQTYAINRKTLDDRWVATFGLQYDSEHRIVLQNSCINRPTPPGMTDREYEASLEAAAPERQDEEEARAVIVAAFSYLEETDEHLVEVRPPPITEPRMKRKAAKTKRLFPWLDQNAPRVILLDPSKQYPSHGRSFRGTHAPPIPHQRRAHWRTLRSERYGKRRGERVRVRSAWIGDREWIHRGSVYHVLLEEFSP